MTAELMDEQEYLAFIQRRITVVPGLCGGRPTIRGMRIRAMDGLGMMAGGMMAEEILEDYPYLERDDIRACQAFAARLASYEEIPRLSAP